MDLITNNNNLNINVNNNLIIAYNLLVKKLKTEDGFNTFINECYRYSDDLNINVFKNVFQILVLYLYSELCKKMYLHTMNKLSNKYKPKSFKNRLKNKYKILKHRYYGGLVNKNKTENYRPYNPLKIKKIYIGPKKHIMTKLIVDNNNYYI